MEDGRATDRTVREIYGRLCMSRPQSRDGDGEEGERGREERGGTGRGTQEAGMP